jgi:hypothetical protein
MKLLFGEFNIVEIKFLFLREVPPVLAVRGGIVFPTRVGNYDLQEDLWVTGRGELTIGEDLSRVVIASGGVMEADFLINGNMIVSNAIRIKEDL